MSIINESNTTPVQGDISKRPGDEKESPESLIHTFIQRCNEDGGFTKANLQELARVLDVKNYKLINSEVELVRAIQKAVQDRSCFRSDHSEHCLDSECPWRNECKKIIAEWLR